MEFDFESSIENSTLSWAEKHSLHGFEQRPPIFAPVTNEGEPLAVIVYLTATEVGFEPARAEEEPTHYAVVNSSFESVYCEVRAWERKVWSGDIRPGMALVEKMPEVRGLRLTCADRSDWYPTGSKPRFHFVLHGKAEYVGALGSVPAYAAGPGFVPGGGHDRSLKVAYGDLRYETSTSLLQVPTRPDDSLVWKREVVSATVFQSAASSGHKDGLSTCSQDVIETVHGLYDRIDTNGSDPITVLWALVLLRILGASSFSYSKKTRGFVIKGLIFGAVVATVTACSLNSECSSGMVCSYGSCVPPLQNGDLCEETADCLYCPCVEIYLPDLGSNSFCQCPSPSRTPSPTPTPSRTNRPKLPSPSSTRLPAPSSSASMTVLPSNTGTPSISGITYPLTTTSSPSFPASVSPSYTAVPTSLSSPSATAFYFSVTSTPTLLIVLSQSPTASNFPTATGTTLATPPLTPAPTIEPAIAVQGEINGHFAREEVHTSSATLLRPAILSLFYSFGNTAYCVGTRLAKTVGEIQTSGDQFNSTSGNYTYNSTILVGLEDPTLKAAYCEDKYQLLPDIPISEHHSRSLKSLELSSSPVFVYRDGSALTLRFVDEQVRAVEINIGGEFWNLVTNNTLLYVSLPVSTFWYTVTVVVRTRINGQLESENAFTVKGERPCIIEDCYFCNLLNWSCTPPLFRWLAILSIILIAVVILWVLAQFSATIFAIVKLGTNCGLYCCRAMWNVTKRKGSTIEEWVRTNAARDVGRAVVIASLVFGVAACDTSVIVSSEHYATTVSQGYNTTTLVMDSIVTFRGFGSVVCLLYQNQGVPVAQLEIKSTSNSIECDLVNPYYTSAFEVYSLSSFRCNGAGPCPDDCDAESPRDAYGEFNSTNWIEYPGETRCTRRCSGLSCGCLLPATGCVYTTYSLLPKNPAARVSEVSVCTRNPSFYYTLKDGQGQLVSSGEIDTISEIGENDDFSYEILSQTPIDTPVDFPTHLVQLHGSSSLVSASRRGRPEYGKVGDIQADTKNLLASGNFTYDPRIIVRYDEKNKHDKVVSNPPGIYGLNDAKGLPAVIGRSVWSTNTDSSTWATKIVSYDSGDSPMLVAVRSKSEFTVTSVVNVVCPKVTFKGLAGCRECDSGAVASFEVYSDCLSGSVVVNGKGVVVSHVYMDKNPRSVDVVFRSNDEHYDETWMFGDREVEVEGDLYLAIELGQTQLLYNGTEKEKAHEGFKRGSWSWWEYSLFGLACLAAIIATTFIILVFVYPSVKLFLGSYRAAKRVSKITRPVSSKPEDSRLDAKLESLRRRMLSR